MGTYSFASGPATLPPEVVASVGADIARRDRASRSLLELPFTSREFTAILDQAEDDLRQLLALPADYRILFLQGGASAHFALVPMNLLGVQHRADYVETGLWSRRAIEQARPHAEVGICASGNLVSLPAPDTWRSSKGAAYCHFTSNETADGLQFHSWPEPAEAPFVVDMSADLLTRPIPMERLGLVYASAQKNLGAAGLTLAVIRVDLLGKARAGTPTPFDYTRQAAGRSKVNTPPMMAIAVAARMLRWIRDQGGVGIMEQRNRSRSGRLYAAIDRSGLYSCPIAPLDRSMLNVRFQLPTPGDDERFLHEAEEAGLYDLRGHVAVGGIRASLYNAMTDAAVEALIDFMADFERRRG